MAKKLKEILKTAQPTTKVSDGDDKFIKKHQVQVTSDANGNDDEVFKASNVKTYDRNTNNHGHNTDDSERVYEAKDMPIKTKWSKKHPSSETEKKEVKEENEDPLPIQEDQIPANINTIGDLITHLNQKAKIERRQKNFLGQHSVPRSYPVSETDPDKKFVVPGKDKWADYYQDKKKKLKEDKDDSLDKKIKQKIDKALKKAAKNPDDPKIEKDLKTAAQLQKKDLEEENDGSTWGVGPKLRLVKTHTNGPHTAKVYRNSEYNEYQVKYYTDGKHRGEDADSFHDDKEDAHGTAQHELKRLSSLKEETETTKHRPIHQIAKEINKNWKKPYFGAVPYLNAMKSIKTVHDDYGQDSGESVLAYGMSNMNSYSGKSTHDPELAKKHRAELKAHLKDKPKVVSEETVEEGFSMKIYNRNQDRNLHSLNVAYMAKELGTKKDYDEAIDIMKQHEKEGHLTDPLSKRRKVLHDKLWPIAQKHEAREKEMKKSGVKNKKLYHSILKDETQIDEAINYKEYERIAKISKDNTASSYFVSKLNPYRGDDDFVTKALKKTLDNRVKGLERVQKKLHKEELNLGPAVAAMNKYKKKASNIANSPASHDPVQKEKDYRSMEKNTNRAGILKNLIQKKIDSKSNSVKNENTEITEISKDNLGYLARFMNIKSSSHAASQAFASAAQNPKKYDKHKELEKRTDKIHDGAIKRLTNTLRDKKGNLIPYKGVRTTAELRKEETIQETPELISKTSKNEKKVKKYFNIKKKK